MNGFFKSILKLFFAGTLFSACMSAQFCNQVEKKDLYANYCRFPVASFLRESADAAVTANLKNAATLFNQKDYAAASNLLNRGLQTHPDDAELQLYFAFCAMETGDFAKAEAYFQMIMRSGSPWAEEVGWYRALACLKKDDKSACREILKTLPQANRHFQEAQKLAGEL